MKSPCRKMCTLNDDDVCLGCGRLLLEITSWTSYNELQRENISAECKRRLKVMETPLFKAGESDGSSA